MDADIIARLDAFFAEDRKKSFKKDEIIIFPHEDPTGVMYLEQGLIEQYDITPEGHKVTVNIFKPHAFFPMSWAMNATPNTYFYAALSDVEMKIAQPPRVIEFLQNNPDILLNLLSRVYKGTDALLQRLVIASSGVASARLAFELLIEGYRFGTQQADEGLFIALKRGTLAARSGLARETVSRELHKFEHEGFIVLKKGGIELNVAKLEARLQLEV
jgi:CRP-like cAMP-binding protein